jgi:hypothetical protein
LIVLAILVIVILVVTAPLRRQAAVGQNRTEADDTSSAMPDLRAAREAKFREIRDAELDHRTGKLSDDDFEAVDHALRAEAIEILRAIDGQNGNHN